MSRGRLPIRGFQRELSCSAVVLLLGMEGLRLEPCPCGETLGFSFCSAIFARVTLPSLTPSRYWPAPSGTLRRTDGQRQRREGQRQKRGGAVFGSRLATQKGAGSGRRLLDSSHPRGCTRGSCGSRLRPSKNRRESGPTPGSEMVPRWLLLRLLDPGRSLVPVAVQCSKRVLEGQGRRAGGGETREKYWREAPLGAPWSQL